MGRGGKKMLFLSSSLLHYAGGRGRQVTDRPTDRSYQTGPNESGSGVEGQEEVSGAGDAAEELTRQQGTGERACGGGGG